MNKSKKRIQILLTAMIACILAFIWLNSFLPASVSTALSQALERLLGGRFTEHSLRKASHFTEFLFLGVGFKLLLTVSMERVRERDLTLAYLGLLIPLLDETIQMFSLERSPEVRDIWIDASGYAVGCIAAALAILIGKYLHARWRESRGKSK